MNIEIVEIEYNKNVKLLESFLSNKLSNHFRYFKSRHVEIIKSHIITIIGLYNNKPIAYGHIDYDNYYWLGICILDEYHGLGFGKKIMEYLINHAIKKNINRIDLTVDIDNNKAINLYKKFNFEYIDNKHMVLNL